MHRGKISTFTSNEIDYSKLISYSFSFLCSLIVEVKTVVKVETD